MGYTIGMPSLKLSNTEGKGGKHCGNFSKVAKEALSERQGLDMDINPELANQNIYEGFSTAEELIAYSKNHIDELNEWRAEHGERTCDKRKLKKDTVVMCATVIKPPAEMMSGLSEEQQHQFLQDSLEIFKGIVGEQNIKAAAFHFDERVPHLHIFWEPMTDEHRICAKEMHNLKFFRKLNQEMPKQLREKGWSMVDDCQAYDKAEEDQKRLEMGEEKYKEYRKAQRANRGKDSRQFKHEVEKKIAEKQKELERVQAEREAEERAAEQARQQREADEQRAADIQAELSELAEQSETQQEQADAMKKEIADLQNQVTVLKRRIENLPIPQQPQYPSKPEHARIKKSKEDFVDDGLGDQPYSIWEKRKRRKELEQEYDKTIAEWAEYDKEYDQYSQKYKEWRNDEMTIRALKSSAKQLREDEEFLLRGERIRYSQEERRLTREVKMLNEQISSLQQEIDKIHAERHEADEQADKRAKAKYAEQIDWLENIVSAYIQETGISPDELRQQQQQNRTDYPKR